MRIMKNFGLSDLRIVAPRDGWPNQKARDMAAHADDIIENAKIFSSTEEATSDLNIVFATASKPRDMVKEMVTPESAVEITLENNVKTGFLFGKESSGLENEDISHCNYLVSIPVSPTYDSLNLAQAVCVVAYELYKHCHPEHREGSGEILRSAQNDNLSPRKDLTELVNYLDKELTEKNFFQTPEKKAGMMINIRNIFTRHFYTEQEIRTLRGIFNALKK
jgi:tRNA/rRNA methyltransferase